MKLRISLQFSIGFIQSRSIGGRSLSYFNRTIAYRPAWSLPFVIDCFDSFHAFGHTFEVACCLARIRIRAGQVKLGIRRVS